MKKQSSTKRAGLEDATDRNKFHSYIKAYFLCGHLKKLFKKIIFLICVYSGTFEKVKFISDPCFLRQLMSSMKEGTIFLTLYYKSMVLKPISKDNSTVLCYVLKKNAYARGYINTGSLCKILCTYEN